MQVTLIGCESQVLQERRRMSTALGGVIWHLRGVWKEKVAHHKEEMLTPGTVQEITVWQIKQEKQQQKKYDKEELN